MNLPPLLPILPNAPPLPAVTTEWFPITTNPVWPGVYEVDDGTGSTVQIEWNGTNWINPLGNVVDAIKGTEKWRGVQL